MALVVIFLSSLVGMILSVLALFSGSTWAFALGLYVAASIGIAGLIMAGFYLHMLATRSIGTGAVVIGNRHS